jgi:hypothetical protein
LTELIRRRRLDELKDLAGKVELELDVDESRRRPAVEKRPVGKARPVARKKGR